MNTFANGENCQHSRFHFLELMNLSNRMNLIKNYQYIAIDGWKIYLLMITTDQIHISPVFLFLYRCIFFLFIRHTSQIGESNTILKRENSILIEKPLKLPTKFACWSKALHVGFNPKQIQVLVHCHLLFILNKMWWIM